MEPLTLVQEMFLLAEHHHEASRLLKEQSRREACQPGNYGCIGPYLLADSFSIEIYLKCAYVQDTGKTPHGHDWEKLFDELKDGTRRAIEMEFQQFTRNDHFASLPPEVRQVVNPKAPNVADFKASLKAARLTFAEKRYLYEKKEKEREWFYADFLGKAIRSVLVKTQTFAALAKTYPD